MGEERQAIVGQIDLVGAPPVAIDHHPVPVISAGIADNDQNRSAGLDRLAKVAELKLAS
jgi:hypothetical protein